MPRQDNIVPNFQNMGPRGMGLCRRGGPRERGRFSSFFQGLGRMRLGGRGLFCQWPWGAESVDTQVRREGLKMRKQVLEEELKQINEELNALT